MLVLKDVLYEAQTSFFRGGGTSSSQTSTLQTLTSVNQESYFFLSLTVVGIAVQHARMLEA